MRTVKGIITLTCLAVSPTTAPPIPSKPCPAQPSPRPASTTGRTTPDAPLEERNMDGRLESSLTQMVI
ncbi:hypothetical protein E2C01_040425 [Portunus trituberculatus]|uniref:Uncharacterized protein n=1 Tax=Portunus trituberculatus TaxID=210409 RepID=A0A5B7FHG5_PORTR|nr:hypothetical protein [Portunus trituberculatus]